MTTTTKRAGAAGLSTQCVGPDRFPRYIQATHRYDVGDCAVDVRVNGPTTQTFTLTGFSTLSEAVQAGRVAELLPDAPVDRKIIYAASSNLFVRARELVDKCGEPVNVFFCPVESRITPYRVCRQSIVPLAGWVLVLVLVVNLDGTSDAPLASAPVTVVAP